MHGSRGRLNFLLERWVQRGVLFQLLLMAGLIVAVSALGGAAAWALTPGFETLPSAVWWSFLRLTDPGYLGDDEGAILRTVSTIVTVLGYVLFMGSLIAILTQALARTIRNLESGLTPITMQDHFVILGWTNRTPEIVNKLLTAGGRLERFFDRRAGRKKLRIVVLADVVDAERRLTLRESIGSNWSESQVFLRSGSSLQQEHLARLDLQKAAVVMIPGADFELGGAVLNDTRVVKTLLNLDSIFREHPELPAPCVVAELFDPLKAPIARRLIDTRVEVLTGDRLVSRLLSQSLRHPGVGSVLLKLLTHGEGSGLYLRTMDQFAGKGVAALAHAFPRSVLLGFVTLEDDVPTVHLNPASDIRLAVGDRLLFIAESHEHCDPAAASSYRELSRSSGTLPMLHELEEQRILILGWSHKIPTLLAELLQLGGSVDVTILSMNSLAERELALEHLDLTHRVRVENVVGDYSLERDLRRVGPQSFDHVLFLASGLMESSDAADARTVLGLILLRTLLEEVKRAPQILVELLDPDNTNILGDSEDVVFVSPKMLSHLLAHVGLLPDLNAVFEELFRAEGAEIELRDPADLQLQAAEMTFADAQAAAASVGCICMGFYIEQHTDSLPRVYLNPDRERRWALSDDDRIIVLSRGVLGS